MPCAHPMLPFGVIPHWGSQLLTPGTAAPREAPEQWIFLHEAALTAFLLLFWAAQPCLPAVSCLVRLKASQQLVRRAGQAWGCMFARDFLCRRCPGGLCCLDDDQMAPGADEPVPDSLRELPLPSWLREVVGEGLTSSWQCLA